MLSYRSTWEFVGTLEKCGEELRCVLCFSTLLSCSYCTNSCMLLYLNIAHWHVLYFLNRLQLIKNVKTTTATTTWSVAHISPMLSFQICKLLYIQYYYYCYLFLVRWESSSGIHKHSLSSWTHAGYSERRGRRSFWRDNGMKAWNRNYSSKLATPLPLRQI